jgi:hypothetical protein
LPAQRENRLITDGSICEDAHSYADPAVKTASDAQAKGRKRCPMWGPCASGQLNRKGLICSAHVGMQMARFIANGGDLETESRDLQASPLFSSGNNQGFINPYGENPDQAVTDPEDAHKLVVTWAKTILYGPEDPTLAEQAPSSGHQEEALPDFLTLVAESRVPGGIDMARMEAAGSRGGGRTNGGIRCDVSRGPCACGAFH